MEIKSLENTCFGTLFEAFGQAFADYEVQLDETQLRRMLRRRGFDPRLSFAAFDADMTQAMLEGVAFAIRDSFEVAKGLGLSVPRSNICGGGSRSMLWKRILANVLGIPLDVVKTSEGPGYGAALLAMVACGEYETVAQACSALVRTVDTVEPDASLTALYEERYRQFRQIYPVCRALFPKLL